MINMFETNSSAWNKKIAFSPKEVSVMLVLSIFKVTTLCIEGTLKCFKVGTIYQIKGISCTRTLKIGLRTLLSYKHLSEHKHSLAPYKSKDAYLSSF